MAANFNIRNKHVNETDTGTGNPNYTPITEVTEVNEGLKTPDEQYVADKQTILDNQATQEQAIDQSTQAAINDLEVKKQESEKTYQQQAEAAYVDYQKKVDPYGINAEKNASRGLTGSGYSSTQETAMFNAYQNRVAVARQSFDTAIREFDISIADAKQTGDIAKAELAAATMNALLGLSINYLSYSGVDSLFGGEIGGTQTIQTPNYTGEINPDVQNFGAFSNGYQPKGISGHGSLVDSGYEKEVNGQYQTVWGTPDGLYWVWDGKQNKYTQLDDATEYGTFENGYQPKGILGHGALEKAGYTVVVNGQPQNVWKAEDGTHWVWDGKSKTYKKYSSDSHALPQPKKSDLVQLDRGRLPFNKDGKIMTVYRDKDGGLWAYDANNDKYIEVYYDTKEKRMKEKG